MNPETAEEDVRNLDPGAAVIYDERLNLKNLRGDCVFYSVPLDKLVARLCPDAKLRKLVRNMIYDGVAAKLLGIEMEEIRIALQKQFKKKTKAAELSSTPRPPATTTRKRTCPKPTDSMSNEWTKRGAKF